MSLEDTLHKKMIKIVLGGVAPIEEESPEELARKELKKSWKPNFNRIQAFFVAGIDELKRDIDKVKPRNFKEEK